MTIAFSSLLNPLPEEVREKLIAAYEEITRNFLEERWEPAELNGGKLSEAAFRVLECVSSDDGTFTPFGTSIRNFGTSVARFENNTALPDGVRFHVPDGLRFLFNLRNRRGVGHVAGDINPNRMDASAVVSVAAWVMAELIRLLHDVSTKDAEAAVTALSSKRIPLIWKVGDRVRVLNPTLPHMDTVLLLLYAEHPSGASARNLFEWCEYSQYSKFRANILERGHRERTLEYNKMTEQVTISPTGIAIAEELLRQS